MTHECEGGDGSEGVNAKVRVRKGIVYRAVMNTAKVRTKAVKVNTGAGRRGWRRGRSYLSLHSHHHADSCIKMAIAMRAILMFH